MPRMNSEDKQDIIDAVAKTVRIVVNGKIDKINDKLDQHMESSNLHWQKTVSHMDEMAPLLDALRLVQSLQKFFKWIGLPLTVIIVPLWLWLKNI